MKLPNINIKYSNGRMGTVPDSKDGLLALAVIGAVAATSTFSLATPYRIYRPESLAELGVTQANNARLTELVSQFYSEAQEGTPLVIVGYDSTETMTKLCDKTTGKLRQLLESQKGDLRGIVLASVTAADKAGTEGLDADVLTALPKGQELAEYAATQMYAPLFVAFEGVGYTTAAALKDLSKEKYNRCCVVLGDTTASSKHAAVGVFAGRVASAAVQRNIGRVADGPLAPTQMYLGAKAVESAQDDISTVYNKGYIAPRTYVGRSGYFFLDDSMSCDPTDDYAHLTARRTVDKAARIAYDTVLDNLLTELEVNEDGTLSTDVIKGWQAEVEEAVDTQMTAKGELVALDGSGCDCFIDPKQDVLASSEVNISLSVRPYGYGRTINVEIGFTINQ
ncbi:MAG: DUF2586 family protein [Candidatus Egerieousia sp.]